MTKTSKMGDIFSLKDKVVLVTGSVGLLGAKICEGLCQYKAKLAMIDINKDRLSMLSKKLSKYYSAEVLSIFMDIVDEKSVEDGLNKILDEFGSIDVLINKK
jgi:NADP-dependent 3-hydroxy acid dehydrogenase YdfG